MTDIPVVFRPRVEQLTTHLLRMVNEQRARLAEKRDREDFLLDSAECEPLRVRMERNYFDVVEELDSTLQHADFQAGKELENAGWRSGWGLPISQVALSLNPRPIHGGFLRPVFYVPIVLPASDRVVAYLIALPGNNDFLDREHHSFLWHYHYLDARHRRSDVILCWDTRQVLLPKANPPENRALFQERHGEGKNTFAGRPDLWGDHKKETMHQAAKPDLSRWKIEEFRCASNKSGPVWPLRAVLTPRGTPPIGAAQASARR